MKNIFSGKFKHYRRVFCVIALAALAVFAACNRHDGNSGLYLGDPSADGRRINSVPANNLEAAFNYVNENPGTYTLLIDRNVNTGGLTLNSASELTITGTGGMRTVQYEGSIFNPLLTLNNGDATLVLGEGITLRGIQNGRDVLVSVLSGHLVMREGAVITGHRTYLGVGVVCINGSRSFFTMEGGEITGNYSEDDNEFASGGVFVQLNSTFIMTGGSITGNMRANLDHPLMDVVIHGLTAIRNSSYHGGVIDYVIPVDWTSVD